MQIVSRDKCRVSDSKLIEVLDLGNLPLSYFPLDGEPEQPKYPLVLCIGEESGLVQLKHTIDPDEMYAKYWYKSGINQSMKRALKDIVDCALDRQKLMVGDIVVDIASNDGTLISNYSNDYIKVCIDPSDISPLEHLSEKDYYINTYFSEGAYKQVLGDQKAKIITSICVFYDLDDPISFAQGVKNILDEDGLWIMEMSYLPTMLKRNCFDSICHEHIEYYSLSSVEYILDKVDMAVEDIEFNDVNGGSFRVYIRHKGKERVTSNVFAVREKEAGLNLDKLEIYLDFANRIQANKLEMINFLEEQKRLGKLVLGFAASTKGNTIMAYYGIGPDLLPFVADRNPMKYGRNTVTGIPIISEHDAHLMKPDYLLAFAYHFMPEFLEREKEFLDRGGRFISPSPKLTII